MGENNKVLLGVLSGVLLGAFGAAVVKRGNLRPHAAKVLSYGYDIKDAIIEQAQKAKAQCLSAIAANEKIVADYERQKADSKPADKIA